jgi:hypothetical protein
MRVIALTVGRNEGEAIAAGADAYILKGKGLDLLCTHIASQLRSLTLPLYEETQREELTISLGSDRRVQLTSRGRSSYYKLIDGHYPESLLGYALYDGAIGGERWRVVTKWVGESIYQQLFVQLVGVEGQYRESLSRGAPLSLRFASNMKMLAVPLEFAYDGGGTDGGDHLILRHPVSRLIEGIAGGESLSPALLNSRHVAAQDLRVLLVASNTYPPLPGADEEILALDALFRTWREQYCYPIQWDVIPSSRATARHVRDVISPKNGRGYDIVHYAGHGHFDRNRYEDSCLYFWSEPDCKGTIQKMKLPELNLTFRNSGVKFFYASCCLGTRLAENGPRPNDDYLGIAESVVRAGVPTVLGFREPLSDEHAIRFAVEFYQVLGDCGEIDIAVWKARLELAGIARDDSTWITPILIHQRQ